MEASRYTAQNRNCGPDMTKEEVDNLKVGDIIHENWINVFYIWSVISVDQTIIEMELTSSYQKIQCSKESLMMDYWKLASKKPLVVDLI